MFDTLCKLRGTAIKFAQMLSMETDLLPEKYHRELAKSYHQVPALNRVLVSKVIREELGDTPDKLFDHFDSQAFAAASLGQVHRGVVDGGTDVAIKIQYPGIHVAMESDFNLLRKLAKALPNRKILERSITDVHERLREEIDYNLEAKTTRWFGDQCVIEDTMAGVEVPKVYERWCGKRVLTTQLLNGKHLDDWLAENPSQHMRNAAAQRLYDLFVHSTLNLKRLHADPNPGNYLFQENGNIGLIDFGCVRSFSDSFADNLPPLLRALQAADKKAIFHAYDTIGMRFDGDRTEVFNQLLKPFGQWISLPFQQDTFDFKQHQNYTTHGRELIQRFAKIPNMQAIAEEFIFFDRTVYGLCKIFEKLQATVSMRHHWHD